MAWLRNNRLFKRWVKCIVGFVFLYFMLHQVLSNNSAVNQHHNGNLENLEDEVLKPDKFPNHERGAPFVHQSSDVIHLCAICHNSKAVWETITFLKSVLYYRTSPIHFHIFTNENTFVSLDTFFQEWDLPYFNVSIYVRPDIEPVAAWIPFIHGPGRFAFKKLLLDFLLPDYVKRVILYDTDMILQADITELWSYFNRFNSTQAIGIGYETQRWYGVYRDAWPAIGYGFNTGLLLCDLEKLRKMEWEKVWQEDARSELKIRKYVPLAEQDLLNMYFVKHPEVYYHLPCTWNMQFGERVSLEICPPTDYKAIHTTMEKLDKTPIEVIPQLPMYRQILTRFLEMDGSRFTKASGKPYRVLPHVFGVNIARDFGSRDVSLAIHVTFADLPAFRHITDTWEASISVVLFLTDKEAADLGRLPARPNIKYHLVFRSTEDQVIPHDLLAKLAVKFVVTTHVIVTDVRFRMKGHICKTLREILDKTPTELPYAAVPTFLGDVDIPWNPARKRQLLEDGRVHYIQEVDESLYETWLNSERNFAFRWRSKFKYHIMAPKESYPITDDQDFDTIELTVVTCCVAFKIPKSVRRKTVSRHFQDF